MVETHPCRVNKMGYLQWHAKARALTRRGIRQSFCSICQRYQFPDEECAERLAQRASADGKA